MLPKFLNHVAIDPGFLFKDLFQAELKKAAKRYIRRKRRFEKLEKEAEEAGR